MKKLIYLVLFCVTMGGCHSDEIVAPQDLFGEYIGTSSTGTAFQPAPQGVGNCYGDGLTINDLGNNGISLLVKCDRNNAGVFTKFDNLRISRTLVDSITDKYVNGYTYVMKKIEYGLFDKTSGKQIGYFNLLQQYPFATPPHNIYKDEYRLFIPFIVSSNKKDTLTHYLGKRMLK